MSDELTYTTGGGVVATIVGSVIAALRIHNRVCEIDLAVQGLRSQLASHIDSSNASMADIRLAIQAAKADLAAAKDAANPSAFALAIDRAVDASERRSGAERAEIMAKISSIREDVAHLTGALTGPKTVRG